MTDKPVAMADAVEGGHRADRDERRPRDREVEARPPLTVDQQVDRRGTSRWRKRGVFERIEREHPSLPACLRSAWLPEHGALQSRATPGKEASKPTATNAAASPRLKTGPCSMLATAR
jgi:hypothetical protein